MLQYTKMKKRKRHYLVRNKVKLVHSGKEFFNLLKQLIDEARHSIHIQIYIFDEDTTGNFIADALIEAAKRKVAVYLVADGFASQSLSKEFIQKLRDAGIHFRFFEPLFKSRGFYFGRRMHHKVIVIDGIQALTGSMNIADRYNDLPGQKAWFDLALYVEGEAAASLYRFCSRFWSKKRSYALPADVDETVNAIPEKEYASVIIHQNDWVYRKLQISKSYVNIARHATERITIVNSYFLPSRKFRNELKRAVKRGVEVRVVLTKISDVRIAKSAERYLYRWLLRNNVKIYEYKTTILHAKLATADGHILTIGSYNINRLSDLVSVELNLEVKSEAFVPQVEKEIDAVIKNECIPIDFATYNTKLFSFKQFSHWISYQVLRLVQIMFTFYFKQKE